MYIEYDEILTRKHTTDHSTKKQNNSRQQEQNSLSTAKDEGFVKAFANGDDIFTESNDKTFDLQPT